MGAGGMSGGFKATSICTMRLDPGLPPIFGVTASEVISHTGITVGDWLAHVPLVTTTSWLPSQQTCWPAPSALLTLVPDDPSAPIRFCLAAILTHLNGRASAPFTPAVCVIVVAVKWVASVSNWPLWLFEPQGPLPGVRVRFVYLSQQS